MEFVYPVILTPDPLDGGYVVTCRDLPEAITQGDSVAMALAEAADCLEEAIAGRMDDDMEIPHPSVAETGEHVVAVPIQTALKATLHIAMREAGIGMDELAHRLGFEKERIKGLLDPKITGPVADLEKALNVIGKRVALEVLEAA